MLPSGPETISAGAAGSDTMALLKAASVTGILAGGVIKLTLAEAETTEFPEFCVTEAEPDAEPSTTIASGVPESTEFDSRHWQLCTVGKGLTLIRAHWPVE